ncbi:MAG: NUDIX domain-containing protein [Xenococcus sp. (in: cyanobacteria)]
MAYKNPAPTVDTIIELIDRPERPIVLIERLYIPYGWAIPGGFIDYGESAEQAAIREAKEEVCLDVELVEQFHAYSDPNRDTRQHTIAIVFIAIAKGQPQAADDAKDLAIFHQGEMPSNLCFDHAQILKDYWQYRNHGIRPHY